MKGKYKIKKKCQKIYLLCAFDDLYVFLQVQGTAEKMEAEMFRIIHPHDEMRVGRSKLQVNNPVGVARMCAILDPRTKDVIDWVDEQDAETWVLVLYECIRVALMSFNCFCRFAHARVYMLA